MSISLKKGQKVNLTKESPGLSRIFIGLGWDEAKGRKGLFGLMKPASIDCDASAILLANDQLLGADDVVYYGNLHHSSGAVEHKGDNLTGGAQGDSEQIQVDLGAVPSKCNKIVFVVTIYQAKEKKQHFGMIQNAFIRVVDARTNSEICRYNLTDDYSGKTAMIFGEVCRDADKWEFNPIGVGTEDNGIGQMSSRFLKK